MTEAGDLVGTTAVVTGANSGLGLETTRALARRGAEVVLACRSRERGERAVDDVRADVSDPDCTVLELDLADLGSVEGFVDSLTDEHDTVDVLVNNAGVMATPRRETADGFELQFGVNHLGHFALTGHLLEHLRAGSGRVVTVTSGFHRRGDIDFEDLHAERSYNRWDQYAQSKLANILFAFELQRRADTADADLTSVAAHPGWAATDLQARGPRMDGAVLKVALMRVANAVFGQSAAAGARPIVHAATAEVEPGGFYGPDGLFELRGGAGRADPSKKARDETLARRLWAVSERETDVTYDLPEPPGAASD